MDYCSERDGIQRGRIQRLVSTQQLPPHKSYSGWWGRRGVFWANLKLSPKSSLIFIFHLLEGDTLDFPVTHAPLPCTGLSCYTCPPPCAGLSCYTCPPHHALDSPVTHAPHHMLDSLLHMPPYHALDSPVTHAPHHVLDSPVTHAPHHALDSPVTHAPLPCTGLSCYTCLSLPYTGIMPTGTPNISENFHIWRSGG